MPFARTKAVGARNSRTKSHLVTVALIVALTTGACGLKNQGTSSLPAELETAIATVSDDLEWERYEKIYNESSSLWKRDATLEQSTETLKKLRMQLVKARILWYSGQYLEHQENRLPSASNLYRISFQDYPQLLFWQSGVLMIQTIKKFYMPERQVLRP